MLNNEQIEIAARKLCEIRGIYPETIVRQTNNPTDCYFLCPIYQNVMDEIKTHIDIQASIKYVLELSNTP